MDTNKTELLNKIGRAEVRRALREHAAAMVMRDLEAIADAADETQRDERVRTLLLNVTGAVELVVAGPAIDRKLRASIAMILRNVAALMKELN